MRTEGRNGRAGEEHRFEPQRSARQIGGDGCSLGQERTEDVEGAEEKETAIEPAHSY
jgi:hypothetical protein